MRDAFGGTFMLQLFLVFIIIYVGFTAVALNYAKAFKVKNHVIDYIESNEMVDFTNALLNESMESYFENQIIGNMNYRATINCNEENVVYCENGIRITKAGESKNTEGVYYKVTTSVGWSIPFINKLLALNGNNKDKDVVRGIWEISGETRLIVNE